MVNELFSNIFEFASTNFRHLTNANPETLLLVALGIVVAGVLLFRR